MPGIVRVFIKHDRVGHTWRHAFLQIQRTQILFRALLHFTVANQLGVDFTHRNFTMMDMLLMKPNVQRNTCGVVHTNEHVFDTCLRRYVVQLAF